LSVVRIGLAGVGLHGWRYANSLLEGTVRGAKLTAISRRDETRGRELADRFGVEHVGDPRELAVHPSVDAVVAVLPPDLHPPLALACLDAGRPVLVEKPLGPDRSAAADVVGRARETGTVLMVAHTLRYDAVVERVRREIPTLGPLRMIALNQRFEPTTRDWIDTPGRGGAMLNTGVHGFDLMRYLTGAEAVSVMAETEAVVTDRTEDEFACIVRLEPGGILATLDNARTTGGRSGRIEIAGERGQIRADHVLRTFARIEGRSETLEQPVAQRYTVDLTLEAFVGCVRGATPPPITASDGLAAVELVEACAISARLGRRVLLDEIR
jgi:myo-inositol 2-dehydrogenase/D-chiro-inositol 1-dehydrogenase